VLTTYAIAKWLHILSSTLLFGTGLGSAYYMFFASRTRDPRVVASVVGLVVTADWLFTATTAVFQPASGFWLAHLAGYPLGSRWIVWSTILYVIAGACWLPVVWMQIRMRDMARAAVAAGSELPDRYWRFMRWWVALGCVAFTAFVIIFLLMVTKPA
jgi:uncharacterized membrane protein